MNKVQKNGNKARKKSALFMIRIAEGMAAWTSFAQATFMSPVYSEALTYRPIFEIARPRPWKARPQKKISKKTKKLGRNQTVDFAFQSDDRKIGIFLEVKFIRKKAQHCVQITKDIHKLILLNSEDISELKPPKRVFRYILLIGTKADIIKRVEDYAKAIKDDDLSRLAQIEDIRLLRDIKSAFKNTKRTTNNHFEWSFSGTGSSRWKYWSVLLAEKDWWRSLAKLTGEAVDRDEEAAADDDLANL